MEIAVVLILAILHPCCGQMSTIQYDNQSDVVEGRENDDSVSTVYPVWTDEAGNSTVAPSNITSKEPIHNWQWQPIEWSWWLFFQVLSSLLGVVGNSLVMIVVLRGRHLRSSSDYLIGHLALADFLTSVFHFPLPRAARVPSTPLAEIYCRIVFTSFFMWLSIYQSILTLMVISVERFVAIVYPLYRIRRRSYVTKCVLILWFVSIAANLHIPVNMRVDGGSRQCQVRHSSETWQIIAGVSIFLISFAIPGSVMIITQVIAARTLQVQSRRFSGKESSMNNGSNNLLIAKSRVLQMLYLVIAVFIICWGPNDIAYLLYNLRVLDQSYLYGPVDRILVVIAFYNSCANPIIYTIRYPRFRRTIGRLLSCEPLNNGALFDYNIRHSAISYRNDPPTMLTTVSKNISRA